MADAISMLEIVKSKDGVGKQPIPKINKQEHNSRNINIAECFDVPDLLRSFYDDNGMRDCQRATIPGPCDSKDQFEWLEILCN